MEPGPANCSSHCLGLDGRGPSQSADPQLELPGARDLSSGLPRWWCPWTPLPSRGLHAEEQEQLTEKDIPDWSP